MKLPLFFLVTKKISGGNYQQHRLLSISEKSVRQEECLAKAEETKAKFSIDKGSWFCPDEGKTVSKLKCYPRCDSGMKPGWEWRPKKSLPRFMIRCGSPASAARW